MLGYTPSRKDNLMNTTTTNNTTNNTNSTTSTKKGSQTPTKPQNANVGSENASNGLIKFKWVTIPTPASILKRESGNALSDYKQALSTTLTETRDKWKKERLNGDEKDTDFLFLSLVELADSFSVASDTEATLSSEGSQFFTTATKIDVSRCNGSTFLLALNELADGKSKTERKAFVELGSKKATKWTSETRQWETEGRRGYYTLNVTGFDKDGAMERLATKLDDIITAAYERKQQLATKLIDEEVAFFEGKLSRDYLTKVVQVGVYGRTIRAIQRKQSSAVQDWDDAKSKKND